MESRRLWSVQWATPNPSIERTFQRPLRALGLPLMSNVRRRNMHLRELESLLQALIGERVVAKTIAGNSISLWFSVEPKAPGARRLWADPPWRIETSLGVESSSDGFPGDREDEETEAQYRARFERACANSDCLKGGLLTSLSVDRLTSDLTLQFNDGRVLRAFATDLEYENWHFTDHGKRKRYGVLVTGAEVEDADT